MAMEALKARQDTYLIFLDAWQLGLHLLGLTQAADEVLVQHRLGLG